MATTLIITGRTWAFRSDLKALGGRWRPDLRGWLISASRRNEVEELAGIADIDVGHYDAASGRITPLPSTVAVGGRSVTFLPPRRRDTGVTPRADRRR